MRFAPLLIIVLLTAGCTSIPIGEEQVFQAKPTVTPADFPRDGIRLHNLFIHVDDSVALNAWHLTQPEARGTVVFFGGQGFFLVHSAGYIDALMRHPVNLLMVDYRGYGKSGGAPSVEALKSDALETVRFAVDSLGADPERLVLHGHSIGTFVALYAARRRARSGRAVGGVLLENPVTTAEDLMDHLVPWYLRPFIRLQPTEALRGESNVRHVRALAEPLLILAGGADEIADPAMARTLYEEAAPRRMRLVVIEGGGHNRLFTEAAYRQAYERFLQTVWTEAEGARNADARSAAKRQP